jgi:hypothetical protein
MGNNAPPVLLAGLPSPPPVNVADIKRLEGALPATLTVTLMFGKPGPGDSESERVHVRLLKVQFQPVPLIAVAVIPGGRLAFTVTVPDEGMFPELKIKITKLPPV